MNTAEALRNQGQQQATNAADPRIVLAIDAAIERHAKSGRDFSANTIRAELPATSSRGLVGARLDSYRKRGLLQQVAFTRGRQTHLVTQSDAGATPKATPASRLNRSMT